MSISFSGNQLKSQAENGAQTGVIRSIFSLQPTHRPTYCLIIQKY